MVQARLAVTRHIAPPTRAARCLTRWVLPWACAASLGACGGGSDGSIGGSDALTMLAGTSLNVPGEIETPQQLLYSLGWQVEALDSPRLDLQLQNTGCETVDRQDRLAPAPANVQTEPVRLSPDPQDVVYNTVASGSTWKCTLWITSTAAGITAPMRYRLLLTGTDVLGRSITQTRLLNVLPSTPAV